jgi:hypothetical protein
VCGGLFDIVWKAKRASLRALALNATSRCANQYGPGDVLRLRPSVAFITDSNAVRFGGRGSAARERLSNPGAASAMPRHGLEHHSMRNLFAH